MYQRIVVAVGDYPELDSAMDYAIALAADSDATVVAAGAGIISVFYE